MKISMKSLFFLCLFSVVALAVEEQVIEEEEVVEIPIQNRFVYKDVLKSHQTKRIAKWGGLKTVRSWPKYHQKFLESAYPNDYLSTNVSFGTPNQDFVLMLSSGGTRAWVFDKNYAAKSGNRQGYDAGKSNTSKDMSKDFSNQDGSFNATGKFYTDHMQFGRMKIRNQSFGVVSEIVEENEMKFPVDGVFGFNHLVREAYSSGKEPTSPIDNLLKTLIKKVTIYMGNLTAPANGTALGLITIGGFDSHHCNKTDPPIVLKLVPSVLKNFHYVFNVSSMQYGSTQFKVPGQVYFDTSFSNVILPSSILQSLYNKILPDYDWDTGLYTVPCKSVSKLESLYFVSA